MPALIILQCSWIMLTLLHVLGFSQCLREYLYG